MMLHIFLCTYWAFLYVFKIILLLLICRHSLCIFHINPLLNICTVNIFFQSIYCLFTLWMMFWMNKSFKFWWSILLHFFTWLVFFCVLAKMSLPQFPKTLSYNFLQKLYSFSTYTSVFDPYPLRIILCVCVCVYNLG